MTKSTIRCFVWHPYSIPFNHAYDEFIMNDIKVVEDIPGMSHNAQSIALPMELPPRMEIYSLLPISFDIDQIVRAWMFNMNFSMQVVNHAIICKVCILFPNQRHHTTDSVTIPYNRLLERSC